MEDVIWFWDLQRKILLRSALWGFGIGVLTLLAVTEKPIYLVIPHPEAVAEIGLAQALTLNYSTSFLIIFATSIVVALIQIIWSFSRYLNISPKKEEEFLAEYPQYRKSKRRCRDFILIRKNSTLAQQMQLNDTKPG